MHKVTLPGRHRDAIEARRAHRGGIGTYAPAKTALLVIDMQNAFLLPGAPLEVPAARGICGNINRLAGSLRDAGGVVVWVYTTLAADGDERDWIYLSDFVAPARRDAIRAALGRGSELHRLWDGLDIRDGDWRCEKDRFSPFSPGASDLDNRLRTRGIANLLVCGTLTNVCCECAARDAMMLNYRVTMVEDANAARSDEDHLNGLWTACQVFADLATTGEVTGTLHVN